MPKSWPCGLPTTTSLNSFLSLRAFPWHVRPWLFHLGLCKEIGEFGEGVYRRSLEGVHIDAYIYHTGGEVRKGIVVSRLWAHYGRSWKNLVQCYSRGLLGNQVIDWRISLAPVPPHPSSSLPLSTSLNTSTNNDCYWWFKSLLYSNSLSLCLCVCVSLSVSLSVYLSVSHIMFNV